MTPAKRLATIVLDSLEHPHRLFNGDMERLARLVLRKSSRSPAQHWKPKLDTRPTRKRSTRAQTADIRVKVMARRGFPCELGEHYNWYAEPHHLLSGSSKRRDERPSNVIRACRECHERYHRDAKSFVPMVVRWCAKHGYPLPNRKIFRGDVSRMVYLAGRRLASTMRKEGTDATAAGKAGHPTNPGPAETAPTPLAPDATQHRRNHD